MIMKKNTLVLFFSALLCTIAASASPSGLRSADSPVANDAPKNVTATQGNRNGVLIDWNRLDGVQSYSVRRRAAQTDDAFEEVALVGDSTCWTDSSAETVVGEFEYTVMPLLASGEDAGPQLAAVMGYRTEDIARLVMVISAQYGGCVDYDKLYAHYH